MSKTLTLEDTRKIVINGLSICTSKMKCIGCRYGQENVDYRCQERLKEDALELIKALPLVHTKRGKWINENPDGSRYCSVCGAVADAAQWKWNNLYFCYHCGADMREYYQPSLTYNIDTETTEESHSYHEKNMRENND